MPGRKRISRIALLECRANKQDRTIRKIKRDLKHTQKSNDFNEAYLEKIIVRLDVYLETIRKQHMMIDCLQQRVNLLNKSM